LYYKKYGRRNAFTQPHIWWGRILVTFGMINGGLGLQLAGADLGMVVAYGCVGGVSWTIWMGVAALTWWRAYVDGQKGDVKPNIVMLRNDEDTAKWIEMTKFDQTR
jgi:Na+/proline symporter